MEQVTEVRVKFSKEEMEAIKTIANIECNDVRCSECPLALSKETSLNSSFNPHIKLGFRTGCFRNIAIAIAHEQGEIN